jgi:serine/threonine-protein kinase
MWIGPEVAADRPLVLGKYRLMAELGHGGMGDVYLATAKGPGGFHTLVVIKRLRNFEDPQHRAMFLDEARLARRLFHPNIVQTYEVGQEEGTHFIVMEYLAGPTLQGLRRAAGLVPPALEIEILCNVLEGLHYAHELKTPDGRPLHLVHRDLGAENVIVTGSGECKILDFGVAKIVDSISMTQSGFTKGKLRNMPREQLLGGSLDRRADIFAAGVMLWEGLTGRPLWGDMGDAGIAGRLTSGDLPPLDEIGADVPPALREICARALSLDPEGRYPHALAFKDALVSYLDRQQLSATRTELAAFVAPLFVKERERLDRMVAGQLGAPAGPAVTVSLGAAPAAPPPWGSMWKAPSAAVAVAGIAPTRLSSLSLPQAAPASRRWIALASLLVVGLGIGGLEATRRGWLPVRRNIPPAAEAESHPATPAPAPAPAAAPAVMPAPAALEQARAARPAKRLTPQAIRRPQRKAGRATAPPARARPSLDRENPYGPVPASGAPARSRTIDRDAPWATPPPKK